MNGGAGAPGRRGPAHRVRFGFPLLSSLLVRDAMRPLAVTVPPINGTPVVDPGEALDATLEVQTERDGSEATVVENGATIGRVTVRDVVTSYKVALGQGTRRVGALSSAATLVEARLAAASPLTGRTLRDAGLPPNALVVAVAREGEVPFPRAATRLETGDVVTVLVDPDNEPKVRDLLVAHQKNGKGADDGWQGVEPGLDVAAGTRRRRVAPPGPAGAGATTPACRRPTNEPDAGGANARLR